MKKFILTLLSGLAGAALSAATLTGSVEPATVAVGELFQYTFEMSEQPTDISKLPELEGAEWLTNQVSQQTFNYNGRITYRISVGMVATREGTVKVPPITVKFGREEQTTQPLEVKVVPAGERPVPPAAAGGSRGALTMREAAFGRISIPDPERPRYVGEEIPMELHLYVLEQLMPQPTEYPVLEGVKNAVFRDYSAENPRQRNFAPARARYREIDGRRYREFIFPTAFRATVPGKLEIGARQNIAIVTDGGRASDPFGDDFFGGFFSMRQTGSHTVEFEPAPVLNVQPLPAAPADAVNLGLVGEWKLNSRLVPAVAKVGEPVSLELILTGDGTPETVTAPKLTLPGFRIYPPEVRKKAGTVEIKYALVPLQPGEYAETLQFAAFNPVRKEYDLFPCEIRLPVSRSDRKIDTAVTDAAVPVPEPAIDSDDGDDAPPPPPREELFYLKGKPAGPVALPLFRNNALLTLLLLILAIAAAAGLEYRARRRARLAGDPELLRGAARRRELPGLLRQLRTQLSADEYRTMLRDRITPLLAEAYHLPPGATAADVAAKLEDAELKQLFEAVENSEFAPGGTGRVEYRPECAERLAKLLKKVLLALFVFGCAGMLEGATPAIAEGNALFDQGKFEQAEAVYRDALRSDAPDPALLYNLGCTAYRQNNLPLARLRFLQAHLLAPRDTETVENLNLVNRKLLQPEIGGTGSPAALLRWCRDRLRPDQYLAVAGGALLVLGIATGMRRSFRRKVFGTVAAAALAVTALALVAIWSQARGPYRTSHAIILGNSVELRTLPATSGGVAATVPGGSSAQLLDRRGDWVRLQVNGQDGWLPADQVRMVFPSGIF